MKNKLLICLGLSLIVLCLGYVAINKNHVVEGMGGKWTAVDPRATDDWCQGNCDRADKNPACSTWCKEESANLSSQSSSSLEPPTAAPPTSDIASTNPCTDPEFKFYSEKAEVCYKTKAQADSGSAPCGTWCRIKGTTAGVGCDDVKICSSPAPASAPATKPEPEPAPPQAAAKPPTAKPTPAPAIAQAIDTPTQGIEQETSSKDVQFTYCPKDGCLPPTAEEGNCGAQIYQVIEGGATSYFKLCSYDCPDVNSICQGQDSNCSKYKCLVKIANGQYNVANTFMSRDAMISQLGHPICENLECYNPDAGKQHHMSQKQFNKMWNKAHRAHHSTHSGGKGDLPSADTYPIYPEPQIQNDPSYWHGGHHHDGSAPTNLSKKDLKQCNCSYVGAATTLYPDAIARCKAGKDKNCVYIKSESDSESDSEDDGLHSYHPHKKHHAAKKNKKHKGKGSGYNWTKTYEKRQSITGMFTDTGVPAAPGYLLTSPGPH